MASEGFNQIVEESHRALAAFVTGDPEPLKALFSRRDDITLANPFGPPVRGWKQAAKTMERAAMLYNDGAVVGFDNVATFEAPQLGYIVEMERYRAKVAGGDAVTPVVLRVTSILRLEEGAWRIVHRHADPIATARAGESVIAR